MMARSIHISGSSKAYASTYGPSIALCSILEQDLMTTPCSSYMQTCKLILTVVVVAVRLKWT